MVSVIVSHPHLSAFSAGIATSLARQGKLAAYFTGVAAAEGSVSASMIDAVARFVPVARNRIIDDLPPPLLRSLPVVELGARAAARISSRIGIGLKDYDAIFPAHDLVVSALRWPSADALYAYEDAALWTFRRARRRGLRTIWDLPLPHYRTIEELLKSEAARWPRALRGPQPTEPPWKRRRKDEELSLATTVVVASAFTRKSLEREEISAPIVTVPYGFPVDSFELRQRRPAGPFTVLSVGTHDLRKGTPYLLEAWKRAAIPDAELHLVGPIRLAESFLDSYRPTFRHWPHVPKSQLAPRYQAADLLVFPTLGDGFGLVIQEAMCCGTPVVTTSCGGGPECITDGVDGWLVPPRDIDALVDVLRDAAMNRERSYEMGQRARARAERWTWRDAGDGLARGLGD
jgi:alpha-maltose-1-phosphate synthase